MSKSDGPGEGRSLEQEIELLGLCAKDAESLRKMAREVEGRLGSSKFLPTGAAAREQWRPNRVPIAGVPRNFATGHMLAMVTLFALVFSLLSYEEAERGWYVVSGLFVVAVVLGQMFLFRGREPRIASCLVGGCVLPVLWIGTLMLVEDHGLIRIEWIVLPFFLVTMGVMFGYLTGAVCAGIFLVTERQWDAGKVIEPEPILAELVSEGDEAESRCPKADDGGRGDPWAEK